MVYREPDGIEKRCLNGHVQGPRPAHIEPGDEFRRDNTPVEVLCACGCGQLVKRKAWQIEASTRQFLNPLAAFSRSTEGRRAAAGARL